MSIILALDIGQKRIGLALTDRLQTIATPYKTVLRAAGKAEQEILNLIQEHEIELVVVGLPLSANGDRTIQCQDVEKFCRRLARRTQVEFRFIDEHLSSEIAKERLLAKSSKRVLAKEEIDSAAAAVILEDFLREHKG